MRSIRSIASIAVIATAAIAAFVVPVSSARAQATFAGALATTDPTFNRPIAGTPPTSLSGAGTAVYYDVQPFYVSMTGAYNLQSNAGFDNFIGIYLTSFTPSSPLTNVVATNDDLGTQTSPNFVSGFTTLNLTGNSQYFFVTTSFSNAAVGAYTNTIGTVTRPANSVVTLGTIGGSATAPEPGSLSLLGMGLAGGAGTLGVVRRKRKAA